MVASPSKPFYADPWPASGGEALETSEGSTPAARPLPPLVRISRWSVSGTRTPRHETERRPPPIAGRCRLRGGGAAHDGKDRLDRPGQVPDELAVDADIEVAGRPCKEPDHPTTQRERAALCQEAFV
jgi:hypothetical protein